MSIKANLLIAFTLCVCAFTAVAKEFRLKSPPVTIEPPAGFTEATRFVGFEQLETFTTIKMEETAKPMPQVMAALLKQNLNTIDSQNVKVSGLEGVLIQSQNTLGGTDFHQWSLIFSDKISTIKIVASYPSNMAQSIGPMIKKTLLGVKIRRIDSERLFQGLPFILNETAGLTYQTRATNSVVLVDKAPYDNRTTFPPTYVVSHAASEEAITDIKAFSQNQMLSSQNFGNFELIEQQPTTVAGVKSHKILARAVHQGNGARVIFYQVVSINKNRFMIIQGVAPLDSQSVYIKKFDTITDNLAFKKAAEL